MNRLTAAVPGDRVVIVNADDFGQSDGINDGVVAAFEEGIVTSASMLVRWPAAEQAARYARRHRKLGVGLHVDLGEWNLARGAWTALYEVVPLDDAAAVTREVRDQVRRFHDLMGRAPSHIDSHQHVHRRQPVRSALLKVAAELDVPLRHESEWVQYCGAFYGQDEKGKPDHERLSVSALAALLGSMPTGVTELCCHPAKVVDLTTAYGAERLIELRTLCDPSVRARLAELTIRLASFDEARADRPRERA